MTIENDDNKPDEIITPEQHDAAMEAEMKNFITVATVDGVIQEKTKASDTDDDDADDQDDDDQDDDDQDDDDDDTDDDDDDQDDGDGERATEENPEDDDEIVVEEKREKPGKKSAKARIGELTRQKHAEAERAQKLENELAVERAVNARLRAGEKEVEPDKPAKAEEVKVDMTGLEEPDPANKEKYPYGELDTNYISDLVDFKTEVSGRKLEARRQQQEAGSRAAVEFKTKWETNIAPGIDAKTMPDFMQVVVEAADANKFPLTKEIGELALDSKHGAPIVYKLAKDLTLAKEVAAMSPLKQAKWFGEQEAALKASPKPKAKQKTSAPTPPDKPARGTRGKTETPGSTSNFADFERLASKG